MFSFILRRLLIMVPVLLAVITITFFLIRVKPGGPFDKEKKIPKAVEEALLKKYKLDGADGRAWAQTQAKNLGLSEPAQQSVGNFGSLSQQLWDYLADVVRGDFRISLKYRNRTVNEILAQSLPVSAMLGSLSLIVAAIAGVSLGAFAAMRQHHFADAASMFFALLAISLPAFVTGPILILIFSFKLEWLPVGGWTSWQSWILPVLTLALPYTAYIARLMRGSMLEVLSQDYIRTAKAKGLGEVEVVWKHALQIAILPVVSFFGPLTANLLTGSIVVETIYNIPGSGRFFVNSIFNGDAFLLGGVTIVYCTLLVLMNLLVDILYGVLDKRITLTS
jgi:oligopeptide transport system permease protein